MKARPFFLLLLAPALLLGCNSFNNWQFGTHLRLDSPAASPPVEVSFQGCPEFVLPDLGAIPPLPLDRLANAKPNSAALDEIQQKHIEELRDYILHNRQLLQSVYERYLENCRVRKSSR